MEKATIKSKGLGRGLDALLGGGATKSDSDSLTEIEIAKLQPGKYQPRTRMDEVALRELADSIKSQGIMQPILVRKIAPSQYEIIAGERRWRAARLAGLTRVPALVRDVPNEAVAAMSLIENIQREDLNPLEEAHGLQRLINEFQMTHEAAAAAVGRSRSAVTNLLRLTNLVEPVQDMLLAGDIEMGHARALLGASTSAQAILAREVVAKQLSVREVEKRVQGLTEARKPSKSIRLDADVARLAEDLSEALAATVTIKPGAKGAGRLTIDYASLDQLDDVVKRLRNSL
ncbi:MAG TPA: ParB/RepB/Spo0J family partition protein [Burkholderiales bacterium]|nr:ParB/RepB/Spo0J family partition protein [Burkholderiales bacterium]